MAGDFNALLEQLRRVHEKELALLQGESGGNSRGGPIAVGYSSGPGFGRGGDSSDGGGSLLLDGLQESREAQVSLVVRSEAAGNTGMLGDDGEAGLNFRDDSSPDMANKFAKTAHITSSRMDVSETDARRHWKQKLHKRTRRTMKPAIRFLSETQASTNSKLRRVVKSRPYELMLVCLVLLNAAFIGMDVQHFATTGTPYPQQSAINAVFTFVFTVELLLRICADRHGFFDCVSSDFGWNIFDVSVVGFMLIEGLLVHVVPERGPVLSPLYVLRVARVLRVTRVFRVLRLLKFFRELRMMLYSMVTSLKSLLWTTVVLFSIFYIFGVMLTEGIADFCSRNVDVCIHSEERTLKGTFGSLDSSMMALFQAMSGGIDWGDLLELMVPLHVSYRLMFIIYISFALFAMANVITGVFVDGAVQSSNKDRENLILEELRNQEEYIESMHALFTDMDHDQSGSISLDEFKQAINNERLVAYFQVLGLALEDVETLFILLDRDQQGSIDIEEFLLGCMKLKGEAKSLDLARLTYESEWLVHNVEEMRQTMSGLCVCIEKLRSDTVTVSPVNGVSQMSL